MSKLSTLAHILGTCTLLQYVPFMQRYTFSPLLYILEVNTVLVSLVPLNVSNNFLDYSFSGDQLENGSSQSWKQGPCAELMKSVFNRYSDRVIQMLYYCLIITDALSCITLALLLAQAKLILEMVCWCCNLLLLH